MGKNKKSLTTKELVEYLTMLDPEGTLPVIFGPSGRPISSVGRHVENDVHEKYFKVIAPSIWIK